MGRELMGNLTNRAASAKETLCKLQQAMLSSPSEEVMRAESDAYDKWLHVAKLEEDYLKRTIIKRSTTQSSLVKRRI